MSFWIIFTIGVITGGSVGLLVGCALNAARSEESEMYDERRD